MNDIKDIETVDDDDNKIKSKNSKNIPWVEKYRPSSLDNIISHQNIISTLRKFIQNKTMPHLLFHGPSGTGKTSTIMACVKELYGEQSGFMVLELNASDERGIETVRQRIKKFVMSSNVFFQQDINMFKLL